MTSEAGKRGATIVLIVIAALFVFSSLYGSGEPTIDTAPPTTTIAYGTPHYSHGGTQYISDSTPIWINATDNEAVASTHYEVWRDTDDDGDFDTLEIEATVVNNGTGDDDDLSSNISLSFTIPSSCHHQIRAYSIDEAGNVEAYGDGPLRNQWNYTLQDNVTHWAAGGKLLFGSSPAIGDVSNSTRNLEVVSGSDEVNNYYPAINTFSKSGIWRCWDANGSVLWATPTETDEARSSPAVCDIDGDGALEIAAGTTSGWNVEVMNHTGDFIWSFPARRIELGSFCWHSSPALVDVVDNPDPENTTLDGLELIIGNNPYHSVWCFDGDIDGVDDGITLSRKADGSSKLFPWYHGDLGNETGPNQDWDVLWVFENSQPIIASPAVDDIDDDGYKDVVIGSLDSHIYAINATDGSEKWNFSTGGAVYSSAAIANLDSGLWKGDAWPEIVVGSNDGYLYCLDGKTGKQQWRYQTGGAIYSSPAVGDVDGDGRREIVVGSLDGKVYCFGLSSYYSYVVVKEWSYTAGTAIYSSPALAGIESQSLYSMDWPMFRHDCARTGRYNHSSESGTYIFIGCDDGYMYKLYGTNGSLVSRFLTEGPIHTSPSVADIDGDGAVEILFYDWGDEPEWGGDDRDIFWCLEEPNRGLRQNVRVDTTPPTTMKNIEESYHITDETTVWLNASDGGACAAGVKSLHYEIWWDSNGNDVVDTMVVDENIVDNAAGDANSTVGGIAVQFTIDYHGIVELRWRATDYVLNQEALNEQEHNVTVTAPRLVVTKEDDPDPVQAGSTLTYTVTVTNAGTEPATGVTVRDDYDQSLLSITSPDGGNDNGDVITWTVSSLAAGAHRDYEVTAQVQSPVDNNTVLLNEVNVTCDQDTTDETTEETTIWSAPVVDISKSATDVNGGSLEPGDILQYSIELDNTGTMDQDDNTGYELLDVIPTYTSYVSGSASASHGSVLYHLSSDSIRWNGDVDVGVTVTIVFEVEVAFPLDVGSWVNNSACVSWDSNGNDVNDASSCDWVNLSVVSSPELSIEKTDSPDPVLADSQLVYHVWVNNTGNANATNVVVKETYPSGVSFVSASPGPSPDTSTWTFSRVDVGESKHIEIHVHVGMMANGSVLLNEVNVTCDEDSSDEITEDTTVLSEPILDINKTVSSAVVEQGGHITYSVVVSNTGTAPATHVVVRDVYDTAVTFTGASPAPTSGDDRWVFPTLAAGASKTITIQADISTSLQEGTTIVNYANVTCDEGKRDQDWANVSVQPQPPDTWKVFDGVVHNVTYYEGGEGYLIHYITPDTTITLASVDEPAGASSGVAHTYYRIFKWNDQAGKWEILFNWQEYSVWKTKHPYDPIDLYQLGVLYGKAPCGKYQIEFYSVDGAGNFEGMEWNDVVVDCLPPSSQVQPLPSVVENESVSVTATANDDAGVANVTLWYRYSEDNETWGDWTAYGTKTKRPYTWEFTPPEDDGFYQFYSVATDFVGQSEALPGASTAPDAWCKVTYAPWDVNGDGQVNILDLSFVAGHWLETPSDANWDSAADVNGDGQVNILDIMVIADHWTG